MAEYLFGKDLINIESTTDFTLVDKSGKHHFDSTIGSIYPFGYCNTELKQSMITTVPNTRAVRGYTHDLVEEMGEFLCKDTEFTGYAYSVSGTDGVEYAIQLARTYSNKSKIVSLTPTWHGASYITKSLSNKEWVKNPPDDVINIHCDYDNEERVLLQIEDNFKQDTLAIITLPCSTFFVRKWSENFYDSLKELCDKYDVIHINDDVFSCWGKHGTYHGFSEACKPDISVLGKGITGGYVPLSAIVCNDKVKTMFSSGHSHVPNISALSVMKKSIEIIERDGLFDRVRIIEERLQRIGDDNNCKYLSDGLIISYSLNNYNTPGLAATISANQLRVCAPLTANEYFYNLIEEKINECD